MHGIHSNLLEMHVRGQGGKNQNKNTRKLMARLAKGQANYRGLPTVPSESGATHVFGVLLEIGERTPLACFGRRPYVFSAPRNQLRNCASSCGRPRTFWSAAGSEAPRRFGLGARATPERGLNTATRRKSKAPSPLRSAGALQKLAPVQSVGGKQNARAAAIWDAVER